MGIKKNVDGDFDRLEKSSSSRLKKNLIKVCDVNKIILQGDNYVLMRSLCDNSQKLINSCNLEWKHGLFYF